MILHRPAALGFANLAVAIALLQATVAVVAGAPFLAAMPLVAGCVGWLLLHSLCAAPIRAVSVATGATLALLAVICVPLLSFGGINALPVIALFAVSHTLIPRA